VSVEKSNFPSGIYQRVSQDAKRQISFDQLVILKQLGAFSHCANRWCSQAVFCDGLGAGFYFDTVWRLCLAECSFKCCTVRHTIGLAVLTNVSSGHLNIWVWVDWAPRWPLFSHLTRAHLSSFTQSDRDAIDFEIQLFFAATSKLDGLLLLWWIFVHFKAANWTQVTHGFQRVSHTLL